LRAGFPEKSAQIFSATSAAFLAILAIKGAFGWASKELLTAKGR
jgi:hypothetical protein